MLQMIHLILMLPKLPRLLSCLTHRCFRWRQMLLNFLTRQTIR